MLPCFDLAQLRISEWPALPPLHLVGGKPCPVIDFDPVKLMWLLTKPRPHLSVSAARYPFDENRFR
jgi:hypothetical protein